MRSSLIQTDNMPYIDTGFVPDGNTRVDFSFTVHPHVSLATRSSIKRPWIFTG